MDQPLESMGFHVWNPLISSGFAAKSFSAEVVEIRGAFPGRDDSSHAPGCGIPNEERQIYRYEIILIKIY